MAEHGRKRTYPLFTVDAFTESPFSGNAAAVCLVDAENVLSDELRQRMAAEMNISETAFVTPLKPRDSFQEGSEFGLRWFTPTHEVDLCGHATLASSKVIFDCVGNRHQKLTFKTLSGNLFAKKHPGGGISLDLPAFESQSLDDKCVGELRQACIGSLPFQDIKYSPDSKKLLIRLEDSFKRQELESLKPLFHEMMSVKQDYVKGIIVTLKGSSTNGCVSNRGQPYDFISRYFAPWLGINEDPVTGSAHSVLGPYWSKVLQKTELFAYQCSVRGGELRLSLRPEKRIDVLGNAVVVISGHINVL